MKSYPFAGLVTRRQGTVEARITAGLLPNRDLQISAERDFAQLRQQIGTRLASAFPEEARIKETLRAAYHEAFSLGLRAGGWSGPLEPSDTHFLASFALEEWGYLRQFLQDVQGGRGRMPYEQRLALYGQTVDAVFWAGKFAAHSSGVKIHWVLTEAEHCEDCIQWAMHSPYSKDTLPALPRDGKSQCLSNCKCELRFEEPQRKAAVMPRQLKENAPLILPQITDWQAEALRGPEYDMQPVQTIQTAIRSEQAKLARVAFPSRPHISGAVHLVGLVLALLRKEKKITPDNYVDAYFTAGVLPIGNPTMPSEVWVLSPVNGGWAAKSSGQIIGVYPDRTIAYVALVEKATAEGREVYESFVAWAHVQRERLAGYTSKSLQVLYDLEKARRVKAYDRRDPKTGKLIHVDEHTDRRSPAQLALFTPALRLTGEEEKPWRQKPTKKQHQDTLFPLPLSDKEKQAADERQKQEDAEPLLFSPRPERVRKASLYDAVAALVSELDMLPDGDVSGLNGLDAQFLRQMTAIKPEDWTGLQYALCYRAIQKYERQLSNAGITLKEIDSPDVASQLSAEHIPMPGEEKGGENERLEFRLRWAMGKRGMMVADEQHERSGKRIMKIFGNTFPHRATFQTVGSPYVWGHYDGASFCWYFWPTSTRRILAAFGEKHEDIGPNTPGRGPGPSDGPQGNGGGGSRGDAGPGSRGDAGARAQSGSNQPGLLFTSKTGVRERGNQQLEGNDSKGASLPRKQGLSTPSYRGLTVEQLADVGPPEPQSALLPELYDRLIDDQRDDVRLIADAKKRGEKGFLLGNGTGTGKTYVALGAVRQLGTPRTLIVVPNQGIAQQWQNAGLHFGMDVQPNMPEQHTSGVFVVTYAGLRELQRDKEASLNTTETLGKFGLVILDEPHRECMKVQEGGQTARIAKDLTDHADFSIFGSATPFETPQDCFYLAPLGLWNVNTRGSFQKWAQDHGSRWINKQKFTRRGLVNTQEVRFYGTEEGRTRDMLRLRAEIVGRGKGVFRELKADQKLTTTFQSVPLSGHDTVNRAIKALDSLPNNSIFAMAKTGLIKRLLDYAKIESAVEVAAAALEKGRKVALFTSNVSPFKFHDVGEEQAISNLGKVAYQIQTAFKNAGLSGELPSPVALIQDLLQQRMGALVKIAPYSGKVSALKRKQAKEDFQAGNLDAIVSTIAAGGTGLSLHDQRGDAPRTQINLSLPWSGKDLIQLLGRTYRRGVKSGVEQTFLFAQHPEEQRIAAIVAGKTQRIGAGVKGIVADTNAENLAKFSVLGMIDQQTEQEPDKISKAWGKVWLFVTRPLILVKGKRWIRRHA